MPKTAEPDYVFDETYRKFISNVVYFLIKRQFKVAPDACSLISSFTKFLEGVLFYKALVLCVLSIDIFKNLQGGNKGKMKIYHDYRFTGTPPFSPMFQTRKTLKCSEFHFVSKFSAKREHRITVHILQTRPPNNFLTNENQGC